MENFLIKFLRTGVEILRDEKKDRQSKYEIVSHEDNFEDTGEIYVKVRIKGIRKTFLKSVNELYDKKWLEDFSREDAAFLAVLFASEKNNDRELIKSFPVKKKEITRNVVFLSVFFSSFLILSNLTAFKIVEINVSSIKFLNFIGISDIHFPAALIFFPLTYFLDDVLTEVYGFKISRLVIWSGLICNAVISICLFLTVQLKPSHAWHYQAEYEDIFGSTFRMFLASTAGYFVGEFCNATVLSKLKVLTSGKWLWMRVISSTSVSVGIDSIIFCNLAFIGNIPTHILWHMVEVQYIFKVSYEILSLPITYCITGYLKKTDNVDYYDYKTKFNPFSLKLSD